ncbi:lipopolysaccharide biosynthesis protein [Embleya hyalina]|uniref:Polysaccharide biosynthesis protein n=1 Tax=Embleya hyalina TaxID=516124 RepID=A0A401YIE1_9ACTN|nr:hypothetical protein [Embleya hyalina]GCD94309.1 hypothetical protein EHYA_01969 [Embleya hyalina]
MRILTRAVGSLPPGTLLVGAGTAVVGAASYIHLAVAGHTLDADDMSGVSVLWTIIFSVGLGLFFPVEQEIARIVAARSVEGEGAGPVLRRGTVLACGMLAVVVAVIAAASGPLADKLFDGDKTLLTALAGALAGLVAVSVTRGTLAGLKMFKAYGASLALDGGLRIVFAVGLGVTGTRSPLMFSLVLTVAPLLATLIIAVPVLRAARPGRQVAWRELCGGLSLLVVSTLLAQMVVNMAVINVKLLEPEATALINALLSALILARVPLFVFGALQASLLPGLASIYASGDLAGFRNLMKRGALLVTALGVAGGLVATALGPWLVTILFDAPKNVLDYADFFWFSAGTICYMLAMVLGQGLMTMARHRFQLVAWIVGTAVLLGVTFLPGDIKLRVEIAYAAGSFAVALVMALALRLPARGGAGSRSADGSGVLPPTSLSVSSAPGSR